MEVDCWLTIVDNLKIKISLTHIIVGDGWWADGRSDGWTNPRTDEPTNGRTHEQKNPRTEEPTNGRAHERTNPRMEGRTDGWTGRGKFVGPSDGGLNGHMVDWL